MSEHYGADLGTVTFASRYVEAGTYRLVAGHYADGSMALRLLTLDGQPQATLTVCVPPLSPLLEDDWVLLKDYSENQGVYEGAKAAGMVGPHRWAVPVGHGSWVYACPLLPRGGAS